MTDCAREIGLLAVRRWAVWEKFVRVSKAYVTWVEVGDLDGRGGDTGLGICAIFMVLFSRVLVIAKSPLYYPHDDRSRPHLARLARRFKRWKGGSSRIFALMTCFISPAVDSTAHAGYPSFGSAVQRFSLPEPSRLIYKRFLDTSCDRYPVD